MLIKRRRGWELPETAATPEHVFHQRRQLIKGIAAGPILLAGASALGRAAIADDADAAQGDPSARLYPVPRNTRYALDRPLSDERLVTTYNNFYEFGSHKQIWQAAQSLPLRPWTVTLDGMVEREQVLDIDDLLARMPLEERLYRHRCVEAWSMPCPGAALRSGAGRPRAPARQRPDTCAWRSSSIPIPHRGQRQFWYPWPYVDGLTIAEATHELAFIATGLYGKPLPKQNGCASRCRGSMASSRSSRRCV